MRRTDRSRSQPPARSPTRRSPSRARSIAQRLQASGIGRGDPIGLLANNCIEWLEIFFAASALGAVVVPFSTWSTSAELDFLLQDFGRALPLHARALR